jgi:hypothetical protein
MRLAQQRQQPYVQASPVHRPRLNSRPRCQTVVNYAAVPAGTIERPKQEQRPLPKHTEGECCFCQLSISIKELIQG